ncbi:Multidrug resistance-associated protein 1 [Actinomortierella wolfii]|nr:Multidrug resistance-associated protein 1 [Actinomortierella wolfii]
MPNPSSTLLLYWLFTSLISLFPTRTLIEEHGPGDTLALLKLFFSVVSFVVFGLENIPKPNYRSLKRPNIERPVQANPSSEPYSNFFARITFFWIVPLLNTGKKKALRMDDVWNLHPKILSYPLLLTSRSRMDADEAVARQRVQATGISPSRPSPVRLFSVMIHTVGWIYSSAIIPRLLWIATHYSKPIIFSSLIGFVSSYSATFKERGGESEPTTRGYGLVVAIFCASVFAGLFEAQFQNICFQASIRARSVLVGLIYRKALRLSSTNKQEGIGAIVNHMSSDVDKILELFLLVHTLWSAVIEMIVGLVLLYQQIKYAMFSSLAVLVIIIFLVGLIVPHVGKALGVVLKENDHRIKLVNELVNHIKSIKLYAWEHFFVKGISDSRLKQLNAYRRFWGIVTAQAVLMNAAPIISQFAALATYSAIATNEAPLDIQRIFTAINLLQMIDSPLGVISHSLSQLVSGVVCYRRLQQFLELEEINENNIERHPNADDSDIAYEIKGGTFGWYTPAAIKAMEEKCDKEAKEKVAKEVSSDAEKKNNKEKAPENGMDSVEEGSDTESSTSQEKIDITKGAVGAVRSTHGPILHDISITIKRGSLTAIVGRVGEGKSSLVSSMLGEMHKYSGSVRSYGSLAYVAQSAWILNDTVRNNILFGHEYEKDRYLRVVKACALVEDFKMLVNGDRTIIGEKGINLSGGQRQRISIARAVYANADVYIFDDPLSAVDAHVDRHIFAEAITKILAGKTRILVTNGVTHLKEFDQIIVVKQGRIAQDGSYSSLMEDTDGDFYRLICESKVDVTRDVEKDISEESNVDSLYSSESSHQDQLNETTKRPALLQHKSTTVADDDLELESHGNEVDSEVKTEGRVSFTVYKYYFRSIGYTSLFLFACICVAFLGINIAVKLWLQAWGDDNNKVTPNHGNTYWICTYLGWELASILVLIFAVTSSTIVLARRASKALHSSALVPLVRSPMAFFDTTSSGKIINRFSHDISQIDLRIPLDMLNMFFIVMANIMQFAFFIAATPYFLILMVPLFVCYSFLSGYFLVSSRELKRLDSAARSPMYSHFNETLSGLVTIRAYKDGERFSTQATKMLDQSQQVFYLTNSTTRWLQLMLEILSNVIVTFIALMAVIQRNSASAGIFAIVFSQIPSFTTLVQRFMNTYCQLETNVVSVERLKEYSELPSEARDVIPDSKTDDSWPQQGAISFHNYSTRYREGLNLVLKNIDLSIRPGERIGIVGRTGAGKSSVMLALFRIIEAVEGKITIDGIDISTLGLTELRSRLAIIPQDPFLFGGSVRQNLDPFSKWKDADIWAALESTTLKAYVSSLPEGLNTTIENGGENMSLGQRQLMSLARAMLNQHTKVVCLDEATAAIDIETDNAIQRALRTSFRGCTVLTIAHRINTIMDSDRILVLDHGGVAEFDTPSTLLANPNSIFFSLANSQSDSQKS